MRKAMLGLFLVVPLAWAGAVFSAEAPPARQQGIGGTVKVQANSVMRLPKRAQELRLRRVEIGEDAALLIPLEVSVLRIEELHMAKNARIGVAPGEVWKCRAIFLWSACKPVCKAASAALEARPANRVRRITPPVAGSTRWMPVVRGAAERTARTAPTAATAAWTSCASEERPAARLPAPRRFRGSGVPLPGLSATGRGAG